MTKREKIILAITGVVAVLGIGSLFTGESTTTPSSPPAQGPVVSKAVMTRVDALIKSAEAALPTPHDMTMQAAVSSPWRDSAIYGKSLESKGQAVKPGGLPKFTGYVELGSGRLAVVDGIEYQAGDTLEGGGYKVVSVTAEKVILESLANGSRVEVPYEGRDEQGK